MYIFTLFISIICMNCKSFTVINLIRCNILTICYANYLSYLNWNYNWINSGISIFNNLCEINLFNQSMIIFIQMTILIISLIYLDYVTQFKVVKGVLRTMIRSQTLAKEIPILFIFTMIGQIFLLRSIDFFEFYLCIEMQSFAVYVACFSLVRNKFTAKSSLFYFLFGSLSSLIIMFGISIIYYFSGITNIHDFQAYYLNSMNTSEIEIGLMSIVFGLFIKLGIVPFHSWTLNVYDNLSIKLLIWIMNIPKISILCLIWIILNEYFDEKVFNLVIWISILNMIIGSQAGTTEFSIKKLFTYSGITHLGYIFNMIAIKSIAAYEAFMFYVIQYFLINSNLFILLIFIMSRDVSYLDYKNISQFTHYFAKNWIVALSLGITLFSMAGIPPFIGFFGKLLVFKANLAAQFSFICFIIIVCTSISNFYYLNLIRIIYFSNLKSKREESILIYQPILSTFISFFLYFHLGFIFYFEFMLKWIKLISISI